MEPDLGHMHAAKTILSTLLTFGFCTSACVAADVPSQESGDSRDLRVAHVRTTVGLRGAGGPRTLHPCEAVRDRAVV